MTHNDFDVDDDIIDPMLEFFDRIENKVLPNVQHKWPEQYTTKPKILDGKKNTKSFASKLYDKFSDYGS